MRRGLARRVIRYGSLLAGLLGLPALPGAEAGDVVGVVKLAGDVPPVTWSHPASDHTVRGSEPRRSESLVVSSSGGIKNAVVFLGHERTLGTKHLPVTVGEFGEVAVVVTFATAEGASVK